MATTDPLSDFPESPEQPAYGGDYTPLQRRGRIELRRYLRILRKTLFFLAAMLLLTIVVWSNWRTEDWYAPPRDIIHSDDLSISVRNARYAGLDAGKLPFSITADELIQDKNKPDVLEMVSPRADILLHDGRWLYMWADNAIIENTENRLFLDGDVNIHFSDGYELQTDNARLNMRLGIILGDMPVKAQGLDVSFSGQGFRIHNSGRNIALPGPADLKIADTSGENKRLDIHAEDILEWLGAEKKYTAEGGAIINNGEFTLRADKVEMFYATNENEQGSGRQEAELVKAYGSVELRTSDNIIRAEQAFYEVPRERVRFIGENLRMTSGELRVTADKFIEYGSDNSVAVIHGTAHVVNTEGNSLTAETIRAKITDVNGKQQLSHLTASKDVRVNNDGTKISGNDGYYDFTKENGEVCGNLRIIEEGNNISGGECVGIDLKGGVSYIGSDPDAPDSEGTRVRGTFQSQ